MGKELHLYGLANCDTVKRARVWLVARGAEHVFHDFKKEGAALADLRRWAAAVGWERLLNRAGTTFRRLPEVDKSDVSETTALVLMAKHPSLIKRPVLESAKGVAVGFKPDVFEALLS